MTVNVTIGNVNDPPVPTATPNPILPVQDGPAVSFSVAPNDPDVGDTHSCVVTTSAAKGDGIVYGD